MDIACLRGAHRIGGNNQWVEGYKVCHSGELRWQLGGSPVAEVAAEALKNVGTVCNLVEFNARHMQITFGIEVNFFRPVVATCAYAAHIGGTLEGGGPSGRKRATRIRRHV